VVIKKEREKEREGRRRRRKKMKKKLLKLTSACLRSRKLILVETETRGPGKDG
jgi:hypothetical protein